MRDLFGAKLKKYQKKKKTVSQYKWQVFSPFYRMDIDNDGRDEGFALEKSDGRNFIHVIDKSKEVTGSFEIDTMGDSSKVYKVAVSNLDKKTKIAIVYFYEGKNDYISFFGSVRLYFITFDNLDISKPKFFKGPVIWEEAKDGMRHYHNKKYKVGLVDYNKDGRKEVVVKHHRMSSVFMYFGEGNWRGNF